MKKSIYFGVIAVALAFVLFYASVASAQNATTNASNAAGNVSAGANKSASGNASAGANKSVSGNASAGANKSVSEFGTNATKGAGKVLNKTEKTK